MVVQLDEARAAEATAQREVAALESALGAGRPARRVTVAQAEELLHATSAARAEAKARVDRLATEARRVKEDLDRAAEEFIRSHAGATPSFKGLYGFPKTLCTSINEEIVHGIPGDEVLAFGDLVSIDCGAVVEGWHGDAAITFGIGELIPVDEALSAATRESMEAGIAAMVPGNRLTDAPTR